MYFAPQPKSALAQFGRDWLGVDAQSNQVWDAPNPFVESPRRYGFHATLKAPMRLASHTNFDEFFDACAEVAFRTKPVDLGQLNLSRIGSFLALTVDNDLHSGVRGIADSCVCALDKFRAPLSDAERARRPNLNERQNALFEAWGYPYVFEQFRFHMTLTSSLGDDELVTAEAALSAIVPLENTSLDSISIFGDPGDQKPFQLIERFSLTG